MAIVSQSNLLKRLENLRGQMKAKGFDAVLINHPANRYYIGGVYANDTQIGESAGWLLIGASQAYGLFSSAHYEEWKEQAVHLDSICMEAPSARKYAVIAAKLIKENGWGRVGVDEDALSMRWHDEIVTGLGNQANTLSPMMGLVEDLRNAKDEWEICCLKQAAEITSKAFDSVMSRVRAGITEKQLAWELEKAVREHGADGLGFDTIVGAGEYAAVPHHVPIERKILPGESVVIDMGAIVNGYSADMTRTICFGSAPDKLTDIYTQVKTALDREVEAAIIGAEPGGHGVGLSIHENLRLGAGVLRENSVVAIEPGIYIPGWGGVRLEETVLVTKTGPVRLTSSQLTLEYV